jgi:RNA:NAD 2'-phosphotransferase (TPT1/KptA family)
MRLRHDVHRPARRNLHASHAKNFHDGRINFTARRAELRERSPRLDGDAVRAVVERSSKSRLTLGSESAALQRAGHSRARDVAAMIEVEGERMRGVTWVKINEIKSGDWAIGGQALRTSDVKALAAGTASADPKAA